MGGVVAFAIRSPGASQSVLVGDEGVSAGRPTEGVSVPLMLGDEALLDRDDAPHAHAADRSGPRWTVGSFGMLMATGATCSRI